MAEVTDTYVTLRTELVQLTLAVAKGQRPSILHWGRPMPSATAEELAVLSTRQWAFGGPTVDIGASLSNELGTGMGGPSGFIAHRDGIDWASIFVVEQVEQENEETVSVHCGQ